MAPFSPQIRVRRRGFSLAGFSICSYNRAKSSIEAEGIGVDMFKGSEASFERDPLECP
jgi:hypothetical protein